ncbi:hypothetical protein [Streptomyces sp. KL118A]|uniref:hypothetical protein n=1 Tax=Streptomyces sp. KL118A TaxID=3045153 RepID=UPI00278C79D1|nr:hypothetical protein [Streptomyces sp. KL118A]
MADAPAHPHPGGTSNSQPLRTTSVETARPPALLTFASLRGLIGESAPHKALGNLQKPVPVRDLLGDSMRRPRGCGDTTGVMALASPALTIRPTPGYAAALLGTST